MKKKKSSSLYKYDSKWPIYGLAASERSDKKFRFCISSFIENEKNFLEIVQKNEDSKSLQSTSLCEHSFPPTKVKFLPSQLTTNLDLLATSGINLKLFKIGGDNKMKLQSDLTTSKNVEFNAPMTSLDWCRSDISRVITSSIDTTCSLWDIKKEKLFSQIVCHDKEVYDVHFEPKNSNVFVTCSRDSSIRIFDSRSLEYSTIIHESGDLTPVLKMSWNKINVNHIATFYLDKKKIVIIDLRLPCTSLAELNGHFRSVNGIDWAPHSNCHIISVADDKQALLWDVSKIPKPVNDPILGYTTNNEINNVCWGFLHCNWVSLVCLNI